MGKLNELTASEAARQIAAGEITAVQLMQDCLDRIALREPDVQAWAYIDPEYAMAQARTADEQLQEGKGVGPLHGVPVGIKDIIDTADMPTENGSPLFQGRRTNHDATCVAALRAAGAIIMGKTVTTELANLNPSKTRNPHNHGHTPGGSSSGSAASVASHMVPLALGTQTYGSIIRPAAFCGIAGYKPTIGRFSYVGIKLLSRSLDTLGGMARTVADFGPLRAAMLGASPTLPELDRKPRIGFCRTPWWDEADADTQTLLEDSAKRLAAAGADVRDVVLDARFEALGPANETIMGYEGCRALALELERSAHLLSATLREVLGPAQQMTLADYQGALDAVETARQIFLQGIDDLDVLLVPSAPGGAPASLASTGNALFNRPWTTLGVPCVTVPAGTSGNGMPLGVQFVGRADDDERVLAVAQWFEALSQ